MSHYATSRIFYKWLPELSRFTRRGGYIQQNDLKHKVRTKQSESEHGPLSRSAGRAYLYESHDDIGGEEEPAIPALVVQTPAEILASKKEIMTRYATEGQWELVLAICREQLKLFPEDSELKDFQQVSLTHVAAAHMAAKQREEAFRDYAELMALRYPFDVEMLQNLAQCCVERKDWGNALWTYKNLLDRFDANNLDYLLGIVTCCVERRNAQILACDGEVELAQQTCDTLVEKKIRDPRIWALGFWSCTQLQQRAQEAGTAPPN